MIKIRNNRDFLTLKVNGFSSIKIFFIFATTAFFLGWFILMLINPITSTMLKFYEQTKQIELIEQPLSVENLGNYLKFPSKIKDLIALDESLVNFKDALKLSSENYGKIFNIKLMKCGGITSGQQIANQAYQNNIDLMWGCNDESIISISAALNTALSFKNTKYLDLDGSFDLERDIVSGGFNLNDGILKPLDSPGLGVKLL